MAVPTTPSMLDPMVDKLGYRVKLDAADREAILALPFQHKLIERSQFIVRERELATHSCLMLSGYSSG